MHAAHDGVGFTHGGLDPLAELQRLDDEQVPLDINGPDSCISLDSVANSIILVLFSLCRDRRCRITPPGYMG
jgi:hypothetical protein